jgi:glutamine synthetase
MKNNAIFKMIAEEEIQFVDLRFTGPVGQRLHVSVPSKMVNDNFLQEGKAFDGSSIPGWKGIQDSDMILLPDISTAVIDPFAEEKTLLLCCDVVEPSTFRSYDRDPRSIAKRAEAYLKTTGIADTAYFGPEPEFFIFDEVRWENRMHTASYTLDSEEGAWNTNKKTDEGNHGHRPSVKGGYFPVPPIDSAQDIRSAMCRVLEKVGIEVEAHHHEVATANQNEICTRFSSLCDSADKMQMLKYVVQNVAHLYGKTATFMPKPLVGDNGSGMHCHQSLMKNGQNIFAGNAYAGLSETALFYIGGIIKHARALNAFTNPSTNSYKRLVPGFEAPVLLAYSARNRSAAIRIPFVQDPKARRIEVRFPDATANPYLAFTAMMMAGLDGIKNKILPGPAHDEDLYELSAAQRKEIPSVCNSLQSALRHLRLDMDFLLEGGVFSKDFVDSYIELKNAEVLRLQMAPHPVEFDLYYSL